MGTTGQPSKISRVSGGLYFEAGELGGVGFEVMDIAECSKTFTAL